MDPNFEIADLPVKLELRYVIESKRAAHGLDCPKLDYRSKDSKNQQVFYILNNCVSSVEGMYRLIVAARKIIQQI